MICELVERSIELVLGILGILMCGCISTPLNTKNSSKRLLSSIQQLKARYLLRHQSICLHHEISHSDLIQIQLDEMIYHPSIDIDVLDHVQVTSDHIFHI
jgi:acyl-CoA synthetase (AMP-forming)/AMP-acid ligase II